MVYHIPKKIHYVWGYQEPKPRDVLICIASWKSWMPDYEVIEWNERTIDFEQLSNECPFFGEARKINLWAYLADYIRLKVLYDHGGIYMDTDMQAVKRFDDLLGYRFFAGFHHGFYNGQSTNKFVEGAIMGAEPHHPFMKDMILFFQREMMKRNIQYLPYAINEVLQSTYHLDHQPQHKLINLREGMTIFPASYFHPLINRDLTRTDIDQILHPETYTIHWHKNSYKNNVKNYLFMFHRASTRLTYIREAFVAQAKHIKYLLFSKK